VRAGVSRRVEALHRLGGEQPVVAKAGPALGSIAFTGDHVDLLGVADFRRRRIELGASPCAAAEPVLNVSAKSNIRSAECKQRYGGKARVSR
jgi:hypothetical protein